MASFTAAGDSLVLNMRDIDDSFTVALSGTYSMTIDLEKEVGSRGSGAWELVKSYTTDDATVSETFYTKSFNETWRLFVTVDTSGTCVATMTDLVSSLNTYKDRVGNTTGVQYQGAFVPYNTPVSLTSAVTITEREHANRPLLLDAAAGFAITMPQATGTGNVYSFYVTTTITSVGTTITAADTYDGVALVATDTGGLVMPTTAGDNTITLDGTTTGGVVGGQIIITDVETDAFHVRAWLPSTGAESTPFSTV